MVGVGAYGRVWGHVAGCSGRGWGQGVGACGRVWGHRKYVVGGQSYCMDGDMWQGWQHVAGCGGMW